jgi:mitochondrial fission protein ELM1
VTLVDDCPLIEPRETECNAIRGANNTIAHPETGLLPRTTAAWVLSDGKIGDEVQCFGIAEALGLSPQRRLVEPRAPWRWLAPYGAIAPRDAPRRLSSPIAAPFPDIVFAAGRQTVTYLRRLRAESQGRTFTVFIKDPYTGPQTADVIWVSEHDALRAENVIVTTTPANRVGRLLGELRRAPADPRIAALPHPRVALMVGGNSVNHRFRPRDCERLIEVVRTLIRNGCGVMVSPSRRTPPALLAEFSAGFAKNPGAFVWDGTGENPYPRMLAHSDHVIVTADSVNMVGEAVATGAPVHVYEPSGGHRKITAYIDRLTELGAVRRWNGRLDLWTYGPIDATPIIAREIATRYLRSR